jgi:hypothetical protein
VCQIKPRFLQMGKARPASIAVQAASFAVSR